MPLIAAQFDEEKVVGIQFVRGVHANEHGASPDDLGHLQAVAAMVVSKERQRPNHIAGMENLVTGEGLEVAQDLPLCTRQE